VLSQKDFSLFKSPVGTVEDFFLWYLLMGRVFKVIHHTIRTWKETANEMGEFFMLWWLQLSWTWIIMLVCVCRWGKDTSSIFCNPVISACTKAGIYKWGDLVTWATKFWMVVLNIFSIIIAVPFLTCNTVYQFVCIEQWTSDNGEVHISLQNCGFPLWTLLHVTLQASRIWRWLLYLWETGGPYTKVNACQLITL